MSEKPTIDSSAIIDEIKAMRLQLYQMRNDIMILLTAISPHDLETTRNRAQEAADKIKNQEKLAMDLFNTHSR